MKIAICIVATKEYLYNLDLLIPSIKSLFLKTHEITIFQFGDVNFGEGVVFCPICDLPWPLTTLLRFKYILSIKDRLSTFDLLYYIDSDCVVVDSINDEIFPNKPGKLVATEHPWQKYNSDSYEINPRSKACVLDNKNTHYFQGCFFGGYINDFLAMAEDLNKNIEIDLRNNIIAKFWDESHLNRYFIDNPPKHLHMGYAYPDPLKWNQTFNAEKKILHYNGNSIL